MKHLAGMALMLCFLLTPALAFSDILLSPMPAAALAVSLLAPNSTFLGDLAPAPTSPNIAPASAPSPAISGSAPASAPSPTISGSAPASAPSPAPATSGLEPGPPVSTPKPANCHSCGDVHIPYPFSIIGDGCAAAWPQLANFTIICNDSFSPAKPFSGDLEVLNITLETGEMHVVSPLSYICYSSINTVESNGTGWSIQLASSFRISKRRNTFTAIGCSTVAYLEGKEDCSYYTGCMSTCESLNDAAQDNEECAGLGCCQIPIPGNLSKIAIEWGNRTGAVNPAWNYSPCSYAFVAEKDWYQFRQEDLIRDGNNSFRSRVNSSIPVVLDWAIMSNGPCQIMQDHGKTNYACASYNSQCVNATQGNGYLCNCSTGYQGNPYVPGGCTNINECELRKSNPTKYATLYPCHSGTCEDTPGGYKCKCKLWHRGDGKSDQGCRPIVQGYIVGIVATVVSVVLIACFAFVLLLIRKERTCFRKNGGDVLNKLADIEIFTIRDLRKITNGYKKPIGEGYFGKVYEGRTIDGTGQQVAVKCSREKKDARDRQAKLQHEAPRHEQEASWKDGFVKEIAFQYQIKHTNVVRLLGCCLETDIPILVFEFIPNGNLSGMLHGTGKHTLSLSKRLDIAIGSAEALSYMHSHGKHNHVHGDLKPDNILLDADLNPKISDFGSSKLLSMNTYARNVAVDGAYKDPVYDKTGRFTVKSDAYSFGVVLLELITRRPARCGNSSLVIDFKKSCKDKGNGREMYDTEILSEGNAESQCNIECLDMVGALAIRCLKEDAEERPTMDEVVVELMQAKSVACSTGSCNEVN